MSLEKLIAAVQAKNTLTWEKLLPLNTNNIQSELLCPSDLKFFPSLEALNSNLDYWILHPAYVRTFQDIKSWLKSFTPALVSFQNAFTHATSFFYVCLNDVSYTDFLNSVLRYSFDKRLKAFHCWNVFYNFCFAHNSKITMSIYDLMTTPERKAGVLLYSFCMSLSYDHSLYLDIDFCKMRAWNDVKREHILLAYKHILLFGQKKLVREKIVQQMLSSSLLFDQLSVIAEIE